MSDFFDSKENVDAYIKMCEDYESSFIVEEISKVLPEGKSLLELGTGPGKDLIALSESYQVTGTDRSQVFVDLFKDSSEIDMFQLDAVTFESNGKKIEGVYDCIFSNKVLQHLSLDQLKVSVKNQILHLEQGGLIIHTLWYGQGEEFYEGLRFVYHDEASVQEYFGENFDISLEKYTEMDDMDSLLLVGRLK